MFKRKSDRILVGTGKMLNKFGKELPRIMSLGIPNAYRKSHMFCFGTTRVGKTKLIETLIEQDIRAGRSVLLLDPKGDIEIFSKIVQVASEVGRENEITLVTPIFPNYSGKLSPLTYYYMPEEIVGHITSGIQAKEEFFVNIAYETTLVIVLSLLLFAEHEGKPYRISIQEIKDRASYQGLCELQDRLNNLPYSDKKADILSTLDQVLSSPQDYFSKVSSSLRTMLTTLSTGSMRQIIGGTTQNEFIHALEVGKSVIMVVQSGALLTGKTSHTVSRMLVSMIQTFAGRRFASGRTVTPPLCVYMDEAANLMYHGVEDLFSKAGGAGVWLHAFSQSLADLDDAIGPAAARRILDNTNTKIFMRVNDPNTSKYISEYAGDINRFSPVLSLGGGMNIREVDEPLIRPEEVQNLKEREFYLFSFDGAFKGTVRTVKSPKQIIEFPQVEVNQ